MHLKGKQGTSCLFVCVLRKMMKEEIYIQVRVLMYIWHLTRTGQRRRKTFRCWQRRTDVESRLRRMSRLRLPFRFPLRALTLVETNQSPL